MDDGLIDGLTDVLCCLFANLCVYTSDSQLVTCLVAVDCYIDRDTGQ